MSLRRFIFAAAALGLGLATSVAQSAGLATPTGDVVLTVSGRIAATNVGPAAAFDMTMLDALPRRITETETPWTKGMVRFEGPLGAALLDELGATGTVLKITALNDYAVEVPVEDFRKWPVILATRKDGKPMSVRDKGPIFVIYPFDVDRSLYNEKIFSRSAWQVKSIEVR
ncbi:MAG: hypothetical protein OEL76_03785 [Siculibacillus sp.]|nr:hypothetical protein [Siculibacillus sp.]